MATLNSNKLVSSIQTEIQRVTEDLRGVDENLKRLTGRDFNEPRTERRIRVSSGGREDEPPPKRKPPGGVFARLGEPVLDVINRGRKVREISEEEGEIIKPKPSLSSSVARPVGDGKSRTEAAAELTKDRASRDRNRRMFGALLGTLQRFRTDEAKQKDKDEQRAKIDKKLEEKGKAEKEELRRERLELINQRKERQARIRRLTLKMARVKEHEAWEEHQRKLTNFIRTDAMPHIFWLPSVLNSRASQLVSATKEAIERELEEEQLRLKDELDEVLGGRFDLLPMREEEDDDDMEERVGRDPGRHSLGGGPGSLMEFNNSDLLDYEAEEGELVYEDDELMLTGKTKKDPERVVVQVDSSVNCAPKRRVELVTVVPSKIRREREERDRINLSEREGRKEREEREKFRISEREGRKDREKHKLTEKEGNESEKENRTREESREANERVSKKTLSKENTSDKETRMKEKSKEKDKKHKEKERPKEKEKNSKSKDSSCSEEVRAGKANNNPGKEFINGHSSEKSGRSHSKGKEASKSLQKKIRDENDKTKSNKMIKRSNLADEEDKNEAEEIWSEDLSHISLPLEPEPAVTEVVVQHVRVSEDANESELNEDAAEMQVETVLIDTSNIKQDNTEWDHFEPFRSIVIKQEKDASPPAGYSSSDLKRESKGSMRASQSKQPNQDKKCENEIVLPSKKALLTKQQVSSENEVDLESQSGKKLSPSKQPSEESENEVPSVERRSVNKQLNQDNEMDLDVQNEKELSTNKQANENDNAESDSHSSSDSSSDSEDSSSDSNSSATDSSDSSDSSSSDSEGERKNKGKKTTIKKRDDSSSSESSSDDEKERRATVKSRSSVVERKPSPRSSRRVAKEDLANESDTKKVNDRKQPEREREREKDESRRREKERERERGRDRSGSGRSRSKDIRRDRSRSREKRRR